MLDVCVFGNDPIRWMCDAFVLLLEKSGSEHNLLVEKEGVPSDGTPRKFHGSGSGTPKKKST